MIKAVVFDMGGVIHTLRPTQEKRLRFAADTIVLLREHGVDISDTAEEFDKKIRAADELRKAYNDQTGRETPALEAWVDFYLKEYGATREQIFPIADELCLRWIRDRGEDSPRHGLEECMAGLRKQGMRLGIISNTISRTFAFGCIAEYGVAKYFEYVLLSSVCGLRKPGKEIFDLCQQTMGLQKEEMAYVGDTISRDVLGVHNAGWALMIRLGHPDAKPEVVERESKLNEFSHLVDFEVDELPEVVEVIRAYNEKNFNLA